MEKPSLHLLFKREREVFEKYKKLKPQLFIPFKVSEKELFSWIGIKINFPYRPIGYFRLYFQDFIVEEILDNGEISEVLLKENKILLPSPPFTLYANLIKVGISTTEAIFHLAKYLNLNPNKIHYAGIKDVFALTSQKIALPNIDAEIFEKIKKFSSPNFLLTNFSFGKGTIQPGQLFGNRFTIFIRTKEKIDEKWISQKLEEIEKEGFLNFYQVQRFGTPRFLSHILGKLILQGRYKEAIFTFLFEPGLKGIPFIKRIRERAKKLAPNWKEVEKLFQKFPYTFRNELRLLSYLKKHPRDFIGALVFFKDQTTLWIYAYSSYLFNLFLSFTKKTELPENIPLFLSSNPKDWEIYKPWLKRDKIENFPNSIKPFRFIILKERLIKTKVFPQKVKYKILPEGVIFSFVLEKGVYATTFLTNFFEIETGEPIPDWVKIKEYDLKKELKMGSIQKIKEILGQDIFSLQKQKIEDTNL